MIRDSKSSLKVNRKRKRYWKT